MRATYIFKSITLSLIMMTISSYLFAQHSVARKWNEINLEAIRNDFARPTVHARNLFHISSAMYDAWAIFNETSKPYLIGNSQHGFNSPFNGFEIQFGSAEENIEKALNYAALRLIEHRYVDSPKYIDTNIIIQNLVNELNLDPSFTSTDYTTGSAAALGNYIASEYIRYGLQDGSNESNDYANLFYEPVNAPLFPEQVALDSIQGNPTISDPNRWQPLEFSTFIDQSGEIAQSATPEFLSPEWGNVSVFALQEEDAVSFSRNSNDYTVYHDPGPPPQYDPTNNPESTEQYIWNFSLVVLWSSHLDATQNKQIDISPASIGNIDLSSIPENFENYNNFYSYLNGGDNSSGRSVNPITGLGYEQQTVALGDYARVLAEFWADGPDSETPPGHWFTLLNYVSDNIPEYRINGQGEVLSELEWDIKAYFLMGGAMHDAAITAWGIKGWYDYIRPISAIRHLADIGQRTDQSAPNYNENGITLIEGFIEQVDANDPSELKGQNDGNIGKIKILAWKGPGTIENPFIPDPETDVAGVDWILAEQWWPYQRPTFITPPFAGYISGHSTYSRAAAEILTLLTGSPFFPNGIGEFKASKNEFLVFEDGPSEDIFLQWATYQDASDQCSLSRIWGGIHPPADDLKGRIIGYTIGNDAFTYGMSFIDNKKITSNNSELEVTDKFLGVLYPNPAINTLNLNLPNKGSGYVITIYDLVGTLVLSQVINESEFDIDISSLLPGKYLLKTEGLKWNKNYFFMKNK